MTAATVCFTVMFTFSTIVLVPLHVKSVEVGLCPVGLDFGRRTAVICLRFLRVSPEFKI
jgi:hypothetical protein